MIVSVAFRDKRLVSKAIADLSADYSVVEHTSSAFAFDYTRYYEAEMGQDLLKQFFSFETLNDPEKLLNLKHSAMDIEQRLALGGKRRINIDPAYMELAKLVVASTKNFSHRIYIGENIYGDVQLQFRGGKFKAQEWTYPDYVMPEVLSFLSDVRTAYQRQLKGDR